MTEERDGAKKGSPSFLPPEDTACQKEESAACPAQQQVGVEWRMPGRAATSRHAHETRLRGMVLKVKAFCCLLRGMSHAMSRNVPTTTTPNVPPRAGVQQRKEVQQKRKDAVSARMRAFVFVFFSFLPFSFCFVFFCFVFLFLFVQSFLFLPSFLFFFFSFSSFFFFFSFLFFVFLLPFVAFMPCFCWMAEGSF